MLECPRKSSAPAKFVLPSLLKLSLRAWCTKPTPAPVATVSLSRFFRKFLTAPSSSSLPDSMLDIGSKNINSAPVALTTSTTSCHDASPASVKSRM